MNIFDEIRSDNKKAEEWLLFYPSRLKQFYEDRKNILHSSQFQDVKVSNSQVSNPTANLTIKLSELGSDGIWLEVIELVEQTLSEKKQIFLQCRRETAFFQNKKVRGRSAWVVYVQRHYADRMAKKYNATAEKFWMSETTVKNWWNDLVNLTARVAIKRADK